jgi:nucleotide-binding universal stress UspA family protein
VILRQADALKADLLVMATRSPALAERLLLGSVAERLVQLAPVPVVVVPRDATAWRASQPVDVLIPLDGSPLAERALPIGSGLAQVLEGDLHLLWVASHVDTAAAEAYLQDDGRADVYSGSGARSTSAKVTMASAGWTCGCPCSNRRAGRPGIELVS